MASSEGTSFLTLTSCLILLESKIFSSYHCSHTLVLLEFLFDRVNICLLGLTVLPFWSPTLDDLLADFGVDLPKDLEELLAWAGLVELSFASWSN